MTEQEFWKSTPRKIIALIDQKHEIEKIRQKNQAIYTAMYVWGKNPDDYEEKDADEPVAGRDVPIDPNRLRGFFI